MSQMNANELILKDEAFAIVGAAIEVHNQLGRGFLEAVYGDALAEEFTARGILSSAKSKFLFHTKESVCLIGIVRISR